MKIHLTLLIYCSKMIYLGEALLLILQQIYVLLTCYCSLEFLDMSCP